MYNQRISPTQFKTSLSMPASYCLQFKIGSGKLWPAINFEEIHGDPLSKFPQKSRKTRVTGSFFVLIIQSGLLFPSFLLIYNPGPDKTILSWNLRHNGTCLQPDRRSKTREVDFPFYFSQY